MWETLTWRKLRAAELDGTITGLRGDMLTLFLAIISVGFCTWQLMITFATSDIQDTPRLWSAFPFLSVGLAATYLLHRANSRLAAPCFLASCLAATTAAVWYLESSLALTFYPLATLIAVVLMFPLSGLAVSLASSGLVYFMWQSGRLPFVGAEAFIDTCVSTLFTVIAAWALGRGIVIAVEWSLQSYEQALRQTQDAQEHRGRLVQAVRQLDSAYYRLQQANTALDIAWRSAETAEQSKTEFVTNISHELRTPLNLIAGFSEMILSSPESYGVPLPASYRVDLNTINRSAQHLLALTNDVIDLARVGMHRLTLSRETTAVELLIEEACAIVRDYTRVKGLWLKTEIADSLPLIEIDSTRIRQVLLNLLTNAARFTKQGGITVSAERNGSGIVIRVTDTGVGIQDEDKPRIFEQFRGRRVAGQPFDDYGVHLGGFGLGLPISKQLIELHGGEIGIESGKDSGTTFWFTLPVAESSSQSMSVSSRPLRPLGSAAVSKPTLILANADRHLATLLRRHVRGFQIETASGADRIAEATNEPGAIGVLAAWSDPLTERTPSGELPQEAALALPVLRLPLPGASSVAESLGASAYLMKPVTRGDLRALLAESRRPIRRILVADDDPSFVGLMSRMLETMAPAEGFVIETAEDGRQALEVAQAQRPDLVFLDLLMPGVGGREVIDSMRKLPALADVPIVVVSAQIDLDSEMSKPGSVTLETPRGLRLDEIVGLIESIFSSLRIDPKPARASDSGPVPARLD